MRPFASGEDVLCLTAHGEDLGVYRFRFYNGRHLVTLTDVLGDYPQALDSWRVEPLTPSKRAALQERQQRKAAA